MGNEEAAEQVGMIRHAPLTRQRTQCTGAHAAWLQRAESAGTSLPAAAARSGEQPLGGCPRPAGLGQQGPRHWGGLTPAPGQHLPENGDTLVKPSGKVCTDVPKGCFGLDKERQACCWLF